MKYQFIVTSFLDKPVEIEANTLDEAIDRLTVSLFDIDMSDAKLRLDDREITIRTEQ